MAPTRTIKAKTIVADIRAGLSDSELMEKYALSATELARVVEKLTRAGRMRASEFEQSSGSADAHARQSGTRGSPRSYLRIPLDIMNLCDRVHRGLVTDISVRGFRTRGFVSHVGDQHTFVIRVGEIESEDIEVRATCTWCNAEGANKKLHEAGYRIDGVSETGVCEIKRIIRLLSIGDRNRRRG